jgi:hypothetical protein
LVVVETAHYLAGTAAATSAPAAVGMLTNMTPPGITGTAQQGQTLTVVPGVWNAASVPTTYQWKDCALTCTAIPNATGQSYVLQPSDVGQVIVVDESIGPVIASSTPTAVVTGTSATSLSVFAPGDPVTNQTLTLVATIGSSSGNASPAGTVTFFDNSSPIPGCTNQTVKPSSQIVTVACQAGFPAGTALLSATYNPGTGSLITGSTSSSSTLAITKDSTSTSLAVTKKVARGKPATYTATVVLPASNSGPIQPSGSIKFLDGGHPIGSCLNQPLHQLTATCTLKYRLKGSHRISAAYGGDGNFDPSTSPTTSVLIGKGSSGRAVLGFIKSTMQWTFFYHPTYTQVLWFRAYGVVKGVSVIVTCSGGDCPFNKLQTSSTGTPRCSRASKWACMSGSSINLLPAFRHRRLHPGTQFILEFTHPNWVGKWYSFTIRAGRAPLIHLRCVGVAGRVGVGC